MPRHYDKDGNPISEKTHYAIAITEGRQIAYTEIHSYRVSTSWLGTYYWEEGDPEIFETLIWEKDDISTHDLPKHIHSANRREALAFHNGVVIGLSSR